MNKDKIYEPCKKIVMSHITFSIEYEKLVAKRDRAKKELEKAEKEIEKLIKKYLDKIEKLNKSPV